MPRLKRRLDPMDVEILKVLSENCSTSTERLTRLLGISQATVRARLRRLKKLGVLRECMGHVDLSKLGGFIALVRFKSENPEKILEAAGREVERIYCSSKNICIAIVKALTPIELEEALKTLKFTEARGISFIILDQVLREASWSPEREAVITYRCEFCGAPITGTPYITVVGGRILVFTNKKCADAYFNLKT